MIVILILSMIMVANCLEPLSHNDLDEEIKTLIGKYMSKIPDIEPHYVINENLSNVINHYFKGKISSLPLYKISLKIDRNPVKIPWTVDGVEEQQVENLIPLGKQQDKNVKNIRHYKVMKSVHHSLTGKPDTATSPALTRVRRQKRRRS